MGGGTDFPPIVGDRCDEKDGGFLGKGLGEKYLMIEEKLSKCWIKGIGAQMLKSVEHRKPDEDRINMRDFFFRNYFDDAF